MLKIVKNRIFIAIVLALLTAFFAYQYLVKSTQRVQIVVLQNEVQPFDVIETNDVKYVYMNVIDKNSLFPNAFDNINDIIGAIAKDRIPAGTVLQNNNMFFLGDTAQKMIGIDSKVIPKYLIPQSLRVIAVNVDNEGSVGRLLQKNDVVDVIFTSRDASTGGIYAKTLLQKITVFDIMSDDSSQNIKNICVMLLVDPKDIPMLIAAKRNGIIDLVLNPNDSTQYNDNPYFINSIVPTQ